LPGCETSTGGADLGNADPGERGADVFGNMTFPEKA